MGVGFDRIGVRQLAKPGECHPVFLNLNGKVTNTERLLNQAALGIQQFSEVANRRFVQRNLHCKPHSFALWLSVGDFGFFLGELFLAILRLAFKACGGDGFKYLLDLLAVSAVVKQERPVLGDREVVDLILQVGMNLYSALAPVASEMTLTSSLRFAPVTLYLISMCENLLCFW